MRMPKRRENWLATDGGNGAPPAMHRRTDEKSTGRDSGMEANNSNTKGTLLSTVTRSARIASTALNRSKRSCRITLAPAMIGGTTKLLIAFALWSGRMDKKISLEVIF